MQSGSYEQRRLRMIAARVVGDRVLDLGHARLPNVYLNGADVTGVDLNEPATPSGYARDLGGSVMDLRDLLGEERFDTIIAAELIEHLEEPYAFLRSCRGVLAAGGRMLLSTPNPLGFPAVLLEVLRSRRFFYAADHTYYFLPRWMVKMFEDTGFVVDDVVPVGLWLPFGHIPWAPVWASYQLIYVARPA